ncbi:reprolysin-like metallopeptidase [Saccharobesus litoralis]|uniref:reprolysin-like metallopeptidase n=1 Tax=Saccharobesus litoralis TaxID=2172099 RepID=UPI00131EE7CC|nr:zinc-dependent metalloprotease family protein [Saccharobesus litoralis]
MADILLSQATQQKLVSLLNAWQQDPFIDAQTIYLPDASGQQWFAFQVTTSKVLSQRSQQKWPSLGFYHGQSEHTPSDLLSLSFSSDGMFASYQIQGVALELSVVDNQVELKKLPSHNNRINEELHTAYWPSYQARGPYATPSRRLYHSTYRLAITTTGEWGQFFDNQQQAIAAVARMVNQVNLVFKRDLNVSFQLVDDFEQLIFVDPHTDPFTNIYGEAERIKAQQVIDERIGSENYDLGHLFQVTEYGYTLIGNLCNATTKARSSSGFKQIWGDSRDSLLLMHELGHQLGANHSFNGTSEICRWQNKATAIEPGSGTSLMSYAGNCGEENTAVRRNTYFHAFSIDEINTFLNQPAFIFAKCGIVEQSANQAPDILPVVDIVVPAFTPFYLTAEAEDRDGDELTYSWEQMDIGEPTTSAAELELDNGSRSLFNSYDPQSHSVRVFPSLSGVVSGNLAKGEAYPQTDRDLNFRLSVRDGQGGIGKTDVKVTAVNTGKAFEITSAIAIKQLNAGESLSLSWQVANTDLAPINCQQVKIGLLTELVTAQTVIQPRLDIVVLGQFANNGQASITMPNLDSQQTRVVVECATSPFFAISQDSFILIANKQNSGGVLCWLLGVMLLLACQRYCLAYRVKASLYACRARKRSNLSELKLKLSIVKSH